MYQIECGSRKRKIDNGGNNASRKPEKKDPRMPYRRGQKTPVKNNHR